MPGTSGSRTATQPRGIGPRFRTPCARRRTREYVTDVLSVGAREAVWAGARNGHVSLGRLTFLHGAPARSARDAARRGQQVGCTLDATLELAPHLGAREPHRSLWFAARAQPRGGLRWWLLCAACGRFVNRLFLAAGAFLTCRTCQRLPYRTQSAGRTRRRLLRRAKLARRVVGWWDVIDEFPPRPRGMHRGRYETIRREWERTVRPPLG